MSGDLKHKTRGRIVCLASELEQNPSTWPSQRQLFFELVVKHVGGDPKFYFIYQANITYTFFFLASIGVEHWWYDSVNPVQMLSCLWNFRLTLWIKGWLQSPWIVSPESKHIISPSDLQGQHWPPWLAVISCKNIFLTVSSIYLMIFSPLNP